MLHFCPTCRNDAVEKLIVDSDNEYATAKCPDCHTTFLFPYLPLYTLEGAPTVGKSTTAGRLDGEIDPFIYEGDLHIDLTNGKLPWASICDLDFRICLTLHAAGRQTLFVGGVHSHDIEDSLEIRYSPRVERCALVCDDADLEVRLRDRPSTTSDSLDYFLEVNQWYREQGSKNGLKVINTSTATPNEVGQRVGK